MFPVFLIRNYKNIIKEIDQILLTIKLFDAISNKPKFLTRQTSQAKLPYKVWHMRDPPN